MTRIASWIGFAIVFGFFVFLATDIVVKGLPGISGGYFTGAVRDGGRAGGIGPVIVSTLVLVILSTLMALPFSLGGAILCSELLRRHPRLERTFRRSYDVMAAVPSVALGLVGWTLFSEGLGLGFSLLAGSLTLVLMLTPIMTVAFLVGLDSVPRALREECLSLGVTRWQALWLQIIPAARPALLAGLALAVGRATAETAALVLTSGISTRMPGSLLDSGASLSVHVYHMARDVPGGEARAYSAALALLVINILLHVGLARLRGTTKIGVANA
jgi:phosphate transport system permease protein